MKQWSLKRKFRIPIIYVVFSILWIIFSDKIAFAISPDQTQTVFISTSKGILFVVLSTLLLYSLLRHEETQTQQILTEMAEVQKSFSLLFDNNPQPMWIYDNQSLKIVAVNSSACEKYGYTSDEFRNLKISDLRKKEDIPAMMRVIKDHAGELRQTGPWRHLKKNGDPLLVEVVSQPLTTDNLDATLVAINDLTALYQTMQELNETRQERDDFKSFSYTASHDLKTPLRAITSYADLLLCDYNSTLEEEGIHYLQQIQRASENMSEMIDKLLSLAGVSQQPLRKEEMNLSVLAEEVAEILKSSQPERKVAFIVQPDMIIQADVPTLRIVVQNLIQNAWKYTSDVQDARIEVGCLINQEHKQEFFVKDNGIGFDQALANQVFEPFTRIQTKRPYEGFGIGLSIVRRAIERHGGRIWVEAQTGKGATFYFTI